MNEHRPAYAGPVDNPQKLCTCGHRADDHWRGKNTCMYSEDPQAVGLVWGYTCPEFAEKESE